MSNPSEPGDQDPPPFPDKRPGAATVRSKVMLEVASTLVAQGAWEPKQARIDLRRQGSSEWEVTLFASDGVDGVAEVASGRAQFAILNPATAIRRAWEVVTDTTDLAVNAIATIPSHDQLGIAVRSELDVESVEEIARTQPAIKLSLRGKRPNHAVHLVLGDVFAAAGLELGDIAAWGGEVRYDEGHAFGAIRSRAIRDGTIDAIADEGIYNWVDLAVDGGMKFLRLEEPTLDRLEEIGYRRSKLKASRYGSLRNDVPVVDFSGFLVYTHASTPDDLVLAFCEALVASQERIPWQGGPTLPLERMCSGAVDAPLPIPFHPAAAWFWSGLGFKGSFM